MGVRGNRLGVIRDKRLREVFTRYQGQASQFPKAETKQTLHSIGAKVKQSLGSQT